MQSILSFSLLNSVACPLLYACAELLTKKYSYDQKVSIESKTDNGIKFTCTGTKKGSTSGDVKASYAFKDGLDFETVVTDSGSISSKIEARDVLAPGLKTSATGHYTEPNNSKVCHHYVQ